MHVAMEEEDFDVLIKSIQAASAIGVRDPQLESARSLCRDIQHRKELITKLRKVGRGGGGTVGGFWWWCGGVAACLVALINPE